MNLQNHELSSAIRYRAHIDGLRGIAVIAVILYHAKLCNFTGGFVGVDVFFVISGFLITSIILRDLRQNTFSLARFWERRIRRILPVLTVVMFSCVVAAYFFMLWPTDYRHFGSAVMAQSVFASNMLFMISDNYFDQPSRHSPILHTWTLSVEEQFYVVFPLIVLMCAWLARRFLDATNDVTGTSSQKRERVLLGGVSLIGVTSFFVSLWLVDLRPGFSVYLLHNLTQISYASVGFYFLAARAWELSIGAAIALLSIRVRSSLVAEVIAITGFISILVSVFVFNDTTPFPGIVAALPVLGAAGVIVGNEHHHTTIGRLLSWPALVFVGLISYSLYLWHWPFFVFAELLSPVPLTGFFMGGLIALVFITSYLSYRFVETPFRNKQFIRTRKTVFVLGLSSMLMVFLLGLFIYRNDLPNAGRIPPAANETLAVFDAAVVDGATNPCFQVPGDESRYGGLCRIGSKSPATKPQFVLWGDSHALALESLFDTLGQRTGVQGIVFYGNSCIPVSGIWSVTVSEDCQRNQQIALQYIKDNDIGTVFLVARWSAYITGGPDHVRSALVTDSYVFPALPEQAQNLFRAHLSPMVQRLSREGRKVYILKQVPEQFDFDSRVAFYRSIHTGQKVSMQGIAASTSLAYQAGTNAVLDSVIGVPGVHIIDPSTILCRGGLFCALQSHDALLYRDENHLNSAGAMLLQPLFAPIFGAMRR